MCEALPMDCAPKDGTWVALLIDYSGADEAYPLEDSAEPGWTLGANNFKHTGIDEWIWMGWDWQQDCICETRAGKPIAWAQFNPAARPAGWSPTHRHVKRGSTYRVIGEAEAQVSVGRKIIGAGVVRPIEDGDRLTVYQAKDGKMWVRFSDEFQDGRFAHLPKEEA
ncbi:hypothetical protein [Xanthobacter sediminis]